MEKYWLYLEPFTFVFSKCDKTLIYNSINYKSRLFNNNSRLSEVFIQLSDFKNLYCIELNENDKYLIEIQNLIQFIRESYSGDIINSSQIKKPVIIPPFLKLQNSVSMIKSGNYRSLSEEIFPLLREVFLYVGGNSPCSNLNDIQVFKQFDYCINENTNYLPFPEFHKLDRLFKQSQLHFINIVGGNVFSYPFLYSLLSLLSQFSFMKRIYSTYLDIPENIDLYPHLKTPKFILKILVDFPVDYKIINRTVKYLDSENFYTDFLFAIKSLDEYEESLSIINMHNIKSYEIKPVYTGRNIDFFINHVYLSEKDIIKCKINRKGIYLNQVLNNVYFGKLRILPSGQVFSDFNKQSIGDIDAPLIEMLYNEMGRSISWLNTRDQEPCNKCVYQWLCPPPSGYEQAIGKNNLCSVI
ncbi:MAG: TIGR04150 pseudo-rSAM protein [Clostridiaceae bacterium]